MLKLKKVAITGGLSCGKSSVCRFLEGFGARVVSADKIVHQLFTSDPDVIKNVIELLGPEVIVDQKINRSQVAHLVFSNPNLLQALEKLIHPIVYKEIEKQFQLCQLELNPPPLFVAEVPLLFESGAEEKFDCIVVVTADETICRKRFEALKQHDFKEFDRRMALQIPITNKAVRADFCLTNDKSLEDLKQSTLKLYQELTQSKS